MERAFSARRNLVFGRSFRVLTMMQSYASAAKLRAVGPFYATVSQPWVWSGHHHLGSRPEPTESSSGSENLSHLLLRCPHHNAGWHFTGGDQAP